MTLVRWLSIAFVAGMLTLAAHAQEKFVVLSVKGKVEYASGKTKKWRIAKVGSELTADDIIRTSFASYVKVMTPGGRLVSVDEKSELAIASLARGSKSTGAEKTAEKMLMYAAKQLRASKGENKSATFGAVRGGVDVFNAVFPKYSVITTMPQFQWVDAEKKSPYELMILDKDLNVITSQEVAADQFVYPETLPAIEAGKTYYWKVTRKSDGAISDVQRFTVLPKDTIAFIASELANLDAELKNMEADQVMFHLIRGVYFERKSLFYNAFLEYKEAVRLAPDVDEYREMLSNMLLSLNLYNEQEFLLK